MSRLKYFLFTLKTELLLAVYAIFNVVINEISEFSLFVCIVYCYSENRIEININSIWGNVLLYNLPRKKFKIWKVTFLKSFFFFFSTKKLWTSGFPGITETSSAHYDVMNCSLLCRGVCCRETSHSSSGRTKNRPNNNRKITSDKKKRHIIKISHEKEFKKKKKNEKFNLLVCSSW